MGVRFATDSLRAIYAEARAARAREICGLLFGVGEHVTHRWTVRNVAYDPTLTFEIDPVLLLAAHRAQRSGAATILGCYHSHPTGSCDPSPRDAADAATNGWLWLIVGSGRAALWRAVPRGAIHGRFDPVPFTCVADSPSPESLDATKGCR